MTSLESFKEAFSGDIVTPSDPDYAASIARWAKNAARQAKYVAFVKNTDDVSRAIKFAASDNLPIAIRGGGHSSSGASSSEGGLVIDLSRYINEARVDAEKKRAYVGGGAVWKTVDEAAIKYGLATVGGTVNHTGVGGYILGGGYGWLTAEHGLAIDNLVQVTIVVADGTVLTANDSENSDLFWAIRGGGSNFGCVTEFVLQLHDQRPTVYAGLLIYPEPLFDELMIVTEEWWNAGPSVKESMLHVTTRGPPPQRAPSVVVFVFYNGSKEEGEVIFKKFLDIGPINLANEIPYEKLNTLQNEALAHGFCTYLRGCTQAKINVNVQREVFKRVMEFSEGDFNVVIGHEFFPLAKINSISNNETAFNNRRYHNNLFCACRWVDDTPENLQRARQVLNNLTGLISEGEDKPDESRSKAYGNYENEGMTTVDGAAKLFGDNYSRLQQLKGRYDPQMLFAKWFPIKPIV